MARVVPQSGINGFYLVHRVFPGNVPLIFRKKQAESRMLAFIWKQAAAGMPRRYFSGRLANRMSGTRPQLRATGSGRPGEWIAPGGGQRNPRGHHRRLPGKRQAESREARQVWLKVDERAGIGAGRIN